jgi:hypothetical protein
MRYLWVVEMKVVKKWLPTVAVGLTMEDGQNEMAESRRRNPDDEFRLAKYLGSAQARKRKVRESR